MCDVCSVCGCSVIWCVYVVCDILCMYGVMVYDMVCVEGYMGCVACDVRCLWLWCMIWDMCVSVSMALSVLSVGD